MAIRLLLLFLVLAFGGLTLDAFVEEGITLPGVVSIFVLLLLGIEVLALDKNLRFLFDIVARLAPLFDRLRQLCQTFSVERIVWIEEFAIGLIETR